MSDAPQFSEPARTDVLASVALAKEIARNVLGAAQHAGADAKAQRTMTVCTSSADAVRHISELSWLGLVRQERELRCQVTRTILERRGREQHHWYGSRDAGECGVADRRRIAEVMRFVDDERGERLRGRAPSAQGLVRNHGTFHTGARLRGEPG